MGNGSSQSIVLGPPKPLGFPLRGDVRYQRGKPKYAQPHNRVLPKPIAGQRLRCTDNGNILHNAGTIRGLRHGGGGMRDDNEDADPEMMEILRRRSEMIDKDQTCYHQFNLRNHRFFHSDPDIARSRPTSYAQEGISAPGGQRRSGGGAAMRASKLRYRKKSRAPEPPSGNSLPRQFERISHPANAEMRNASQERKVLCRCVDGRPDWKPKSKAPPPPPNSAAEPPPPPPPLPSTSGGHAVTGSPQETSVTRTTHGGPSVTRLTDAAQSRIQGYEKNVHPLSKWRNSRSVGDIRIEEEEECATESRTTVFDSKAHLSGAQVKKPPLLNSEPDAFQKEIVAVTKKIAENRQQSESKNSPLCSKVADQKSSYQTNSSPKQYYFCDAGAFKSLSSNNAFNFNTEESAWSALESSSSKGQKVVCTSDVIVHSSADGHTQEKKQVSKSAESNALFFSPPQRNEKKPAPSSELSPTASLDRKRSEEWAALHESLMQKNQGDSDIDIKLRPVLPRKTILIPKFSPVEAWQALGSDGGVGSSNQSTSEGDEGLEPIRRCNLPTAPSRTPGMIYIEQRPVNNTFKTTCDAYHWTPRQDLADDSDASSVNSEDAVLPRIHECKPVDIPKRFSLPTVMFSNMRPIGTEISSNKIIGNIHNHNSFTEATEAVPLKSVNKKKYQMSAPDIRAEGNTSTNLKKFLGIRNKYFSEEDISASDSNWTFGKYALLKKGKQYSSDLMLAKDKKRYELIDKHNSGELLGDVLISKANDVQEKLRYSELANTNFSFYSTEGHVMYLPSEDNHSLARHYNNDDIPSPPTKGRVYHTRRIAENTEPHPQTKPYPKAKKRQDIAEREMDRKRNLELVRMLEEEVRRRRNKEKISIRQQLQMMKRLSSVDDDDEDDEDEFDDEAYFTEPKSRDGGYSPQCMDTLVHPKFLSQERRAHQNICSTTLSQWKSSPALLEEVLQRGPRRTVRDSSSSITSSPDLGDSKYKPRSAGVDPSTGKQQKPDRSRKICDDVVDVERSSSDDLGIASDRPSPSSGVGGEIKNISSSERRERKTANIYKQLMDIVRREERQMNKACGGDEEHTSRDSSSSQHASSLSATSSSSSSISYSCSDSVDHKIVRSSSTSKSGIPANNEFHHASLGVESPSNRARCSGTDFSAKSPFQVALVQPFNPTNKGYRPVPFDVVVSTTAASGTGWKNSGLLDL